MRTLFAEFEDHMKYDHLLLRLLVYLSTEDDVDVILDHAVHVPVYIFAVHISNQCQQHNKLCQKKVNYIYTRIVNYEHMHTNMYVVNYVLVYICIETL